tara:strand:+ start:897 stop:1067 length:171 start_codon:yes stop_codon:yes gene_type:complete
MWVNCWNCNGGGFIYNDKKLSPCVKCNYNNQTHFYLTGQIWVEDEYEPIIEPDEPN